MQLWSGDQVIGMKLRLCPSGISENVGGGGGIWDNVLRETWTWSLGVAQLYHKGPCFNISRPIGILRSDLFSHAVFVFFVWFAFYSLEVSRIRFFFFSFISYMIFDFDIFGYLLVLLEETNLFRKVKIVVNLV